VNTIGDWLRRQFARRHEPQKNRPPQNPLVAATAAKYEACHAAAEVWERLGLSVKGTEQFCRLAAVLSGDEHADLHEACRLVLNERRAAGIRRQRTLLKKRGDQPRSDSGFIIWSGLPFWRSREPCTF
jgi:hypothetical protein